MAKDKLGNARVPSLLIYEGAKKCTFIGKMLCFGTSVFSTMIAAGALRVPLGALLL
jgi:hypothetical protein